MVVAGILVLLAFLFTMAILDLWMKGKHIQYCPLFHDAQTIELPE